MRSRLVATVVTLGVVAALVTVPASSAAATAASESFESFTLGSVNGQGGWGVTGAAYDYGVADTTGLYAGALGSRSLRVSNAVTSGSFGDHLFSASVANEAGETSAQNGGLSGGTRQKRYTTSFTFASASPAAEQVGLRIGISPDRGDGARMSLVRLYDTPTGLKVTAFGFSSTDSGPPESNFPETTVASGLDRTVPHSVTLTMDFLDGASNDRVAIVVDGGAPVVISSWEQYFRESEGNPSRTVDSLLIRSSGPAIPALAGLGFFLDDITQTTGATPVPPRTTTVVTPSVLGQHTDGWTAVKESAWASSATGRFVKGPAGADGDGSFRVSLGPVTGANNGKYYVGRSVTDVPLGSLTGFSYRVLTPTTNNGVMQPYVNIPISGGGVTYANLVYDPNDSASNPTPLPATNGVWRTFDPFSPTAKWRATRVVAGKATWTYRTLLEWLQLAPDLRTHSVAGGVFVVFGASSVYAPWTDYLAYLDGFDLTIAGAATSSSFEPGRPVAPTALTVDPITARTATLTWTDGPGAEFSPVEEWEVVVDGTPFTVPGGTTSFPLTGLAPGSTHLASVRSYTAGESSAWVGTSFSTSTIPVPVTVSGLVASAITRTSASISWAASAIVGDGAVDSYDVTVNGTPTIVGAATLGRALSGLVAGSTNTVILRAHNESGWSDPTSVTFTTNDLDRRTPGAPSLAVGDPDGTGLVTASWTPNGGDSADFPVTAWIVAVDGTDEASLAATARSYSISGLTAGRHTVSVRGVNALGSAAFAAQVLVVESTNASLPTSVLTAVPSVVKAGSPSTLRGTFALDGNPRTDAVVTLWARTGATWTSVGSTVTDDLGQFAYAVTPVRTTLYRALTAGLPSAYATVTVRPSVTTKLLTSTKRGVTLVRVSAVAKPAAVGAVTRLQRLVGRSWRTVATGKLSTSSAVVLTAGRFTRVTAKYRVVVSATRSSVAVVSPTFTVRLPTRR